MTGLARRRGRHGAGLAAALTLLAAGACVEQRPADPPAEAAGTAVTEAAEAIVEPRPFRTALARHGIDLALPAEGKAIVVNIPAFELIAVEDGAPVLRSRVIVGTPWTPTPVMATQTSAVRFRPTWRPTPAMVASGEYPDRRWPPGPRNPLGLAAIRLEPGLLVYLHDTNRRDLFARPDRALSHGCIRVERWDEVIAWLLDMDLATVHRHAEGRRTFDIPAPPVPVLIVYRTRFPADDGSLERFADVYRREAARPPPPRAAETGAGPGPGSGATCVAG